MDRPLGKKFDPRPKKIHRSDGSYWVANPCVSEHFLTKQIGDLDKQKTQYSANQIREQRELQRELQNIKATKSYRPGPGYFRRRGSRQHSMVDTTFSDMIEKFNKRRVEQNFVNNLLKQRRESMYNLSADNKARKSTANIWNGIAEAKADILQLDLDTNYDSYTDDEIDDKSDISRERQQKPFQRRALSKRKSVYEVKKDRVHTETFGVDEPEDATVRHIQQANRRPSYALDREHRDFKSVADQSHSISRDAKQSKLGTRRAANLWGLVREKALGPEDLKRCKDQNDDSKQNNMSIQNNDSDKATSVQAKTDDQKLLEKEQVGTRINNEQVGTHINNEQVGTHINKNQVGTHINKEQVGTQINNEQVGTHINNEQVGTHLNNAHNKEQDAINLGSLLPDEKQKNDKLPNGTLSYSNEKPTNDKANKTTQRRNCTPSKSGRRSTERPIPNGHIPSANKSTSRFQKVPAKDAKTMSPRPKSAKGRVRTNKRNTQQHTESIKSTLQTIAAEMKSIIDRKGESGEENKEAKKGHSLSKSIAASDDDASLNNFLYSDMSENDKSRNSDRKLSCFDLNIDDSFLENRRPSERLGHVSDLTEVACSIDHVSDNASKISHPSPKSSSNSRRNSTSRKGSIQSHKNLNTDEILEKLRQEKMNDELWDDVRRCRYLRGYDPPEMIMPANVNVFVFGKDENDIIEEIRLEKLATGDQGDQKDDSHTSI